jgi:hypothetical protein
MQLNRRQVQNPCVQISIQLLTVVMLMQLLAESTYTCVLLSIHLLTSQLKFLCCRLTNSWYTVFLCYSLTAAQLTAAILSATSVGDPDPHDFGPPGSADPDPLVRGTDPDPHQNDTDPQHWLVQYFSVPLTVAQLRAGALFLCLSESWYGTSIHVLQLTAAYPRAGALFWCVQSKAAHRTASMVF